MKTSRALHADTSVPKRLKKLLSSKRHALILCLAEKKLISQKISFVDYEKRLFENGSIFTHNTSLLRHTIYKLLEHNLKATKLFLTHMSHIMELPLLVVTSRPPKRSHEHKVWYLARNHESGTSYQDSMTPSQAPSRMSHKQNRFTDSHVK